MPSSYIHTSHNAELLINTLSAEWGLSMAGLNAQSILLSPPSFFLSLCISVDWPKPKAQIFFFLLQAAVQV